VTPANSLRLRRREIEMASIGQFTHPRGWKIKSWHVTGEGNIPNHGFEVGGTLFIVPLPSGTEGCALNWHNTDGSTPRPASCTARPFR
jgi:hypothetical protein